MNIGTYVFLVIFIIFIIIALTNIIINIDFKITANKAKQLTIKAKEKTVKNKIEKAISMGSFSIVINNLDKENYKYFKNLGFKIDCNKTFPYTYISWKD